MMQKTVYVQFSYRKWPLPVKQRGGFEITAGSMEDCIMKAVTKFNTDIAHYSPAYVFFNIENGLELAHEFNYMGINGK